MITIEFLRYRNLAIDALTIKPGLTTIIGPNGSGKTTCLRICAGIILPDSGTVTIDTLSPRETEIGWVNEFLTGTFCLRP
jgi:ABC-type multidrug transport system ATPase subunit